jgi:hypothetical protein
MEATQAVPMEQEDRTHVDLALGPRPRTDQVGMATAD